MPVCPEASWRTGFKLGAWVIRQRSGHGNGTISDVQVERLEKLPGWVWDARAKGGRTGIRCLRRFVERRGTSRVPQDHVEGGFRLGTWVTQQRSYYRAGKLNALRVERLEALPGWAWEPDADAWEKGFGYLRRFVEREGNSLVPRGFVEDGFRLDSWVSVQRTQIRKEKAFARAHCAARTGARMGVELT